MTGYQKLKEENERLKRSQRFETNRATAYFFALIKYLPEDKKDEAANIIEYMLKQHEENRDMAKMDPALAILRKEK